MALARALVAGMGLVLFDEPLSNLDADLREQLRLEIATLVRASGATAVYITHDQGEAFALADRIVVLRSGRVVQQGTPEEVFHRPSDAFVARFTGVAGEVEVRDVRPSAHGATARAQLPEYLGGAEVDVRITGSASPRRPRVFVRPNGASIVPSSRGAHLEALVCDVAFCGRGYEHALAMTNGSLLTRVFSTTRFDRGSPVGVVLEPGGCLLVDDAEDLAEGLPAGTGFDGPAGRAGSGPELRDPRDAAEHHDLVRATTPRHEMHDEAGS